MAFMNTVAGIYQPSVPFARYGILSTPEKRYHQFEASSDIKFYNGFSIRCGTDGQSAGVSQVQNSG